MGSVALATRINLAALSQHLSSKMGYAIGIKHIFISLRRSPSQVVNKAAISSERK
jgi:hypothetical protein